MFSFEEEKQERSNTIIKVLGIGGGGSNAVMRMSNPSELNCLELIIANTDLQALNTNPVPNKIQLGAKLTKGLGAGSNPDIGEKAAQEDREAIRERLYGADMVFITAGMGGGTGTGAAPIIAEIARDIGALTVAVVTKPFLFEGPKRMRQADEGINKLVDKVDTLIVIPNQRLLSVVEKHTSITEAFRLADEILHQGIIGISEVITEPGLINVDFADVRTVMNQKGKALMGIGTGDGEERAKKAAKEAVTSPLLEDASIEGATGILINITGGEDLGLQEITEACDIIIEKADKDVHVIFGAVVNKEYTGRIKITVIATGFGKRKTGLEPLKEMPKPEEIPHQQPSFLSDFEIPAFLRRSRP
ncbi:TPA: cell division protein FtsZ [bacterium]|nr:cell division protein FtsZ [bacterium]